MNTVTTVVLFLLALSPLAVSALIRSGKGKKRALIVNIVSVAFVCVLIFGGSATSVLAQETETAAAGSALSTTSVGAGLGMLAAALVTALSCVGAGIAVASSASAAIGAMSENPKSFGKSLIFVALAEGVALYGLLISIQILTLLQ